MRNNNHHINELCHAYFYAKRFVIKKGYSSEVDWQESVKISDIGEEEFLKETAWVILSSGMNEKIIKKVFPGISDVFFGWKSAKKIVLNKDICYSNSLSIFGHKKKISAIITIADVIVQKGFKNFKKEITLKGVNFLETIPYIGSVTKFHLAKNIGLNYSKPDRHLERISKKLGFKSTESLCSLIANKTNEKESVVDLVIWRYATLNNNYLDAISYLLTKQPFNSSNVNNFHRINT